GLAALPGAAVGRHRGRPDLVAARLAASDAATVARPDRRTLRHGVRGADRAGLARPRLGGARLCRGLLALRALRAADQRPQLPGFPDLDGQISVDVAAALALAGPLAPAHLADGRAVNAGTALLRGALGQPRLDRLSLPIRLPRRLLARAAQSRG